MIDLYIITKPNKMSLYNSMWYARTCQVVHKDLIRKCNGKDPHTIFYNFRLYIYSIYHRKNFPVQATNYSN